ncbi:type II toxin-antitoxin system RelE/ParE family toxin [Caulobacter sp.]|uniref:type II toxin-antitoxin system RelE/ParE family toxin n=1 Tax=Caulobacter sp. TaxID=78 RepID=UPI0031DA5272
MSSYLIAWSPRSRRDLEAIHAYIAQHAPMAAGRLAAALIDTVESLATHPDRGRAVNGAVRELVVIRPYLIRYRVASSRVEILRIKRSARL